jgi:medium-chain acyl-[acyl-carrier-protein] hydrolase
MCSQSRAPHDTSGTGPSWVNATSPRPVSGLRLICLPPAGGGASRYREWPTYLPDHVEVLPVQLPGRENRFHEPAIDSMELLVGRLVEEVSSHLDRPFAFFGHSMGALLAFELIKRLRPMRLEPVHFFVSGCRAPHLPRSRSPDRHVLPDREFMAAVQALNGIPPELLENPEFTDLVLPTLRSDFTLVETYVFRPERALDCAISAFGGLRDNEVIRDELEAWSCHTTGSFKVHMLPGDHFFVDSARASLLRLLTKELDHRTPSGEPSQGGVKELPEARPM